MSASHIKDLFARSISDGEDFARTIQDAVNDLCFLMQQQHGGSFKSVISHESEAIFIHADMREVKA